MNEQLPPSSPIPERRRRGGVVGGAILITIGIMALLSQIPGLNAGLFFLPALGAIFLVAGVVSRQVGLLIPGGILAGIGAGTILMEGPFHFVEDPARGGIFMLAFAGGWLLISLAALLIQCKIWWPLVPGGIMALIGVSLLAGQPGLEVLKYASYGWPVILIAVGLYLLLRRKDLEK